MPKTCKMFPVLIVVTNWHDITHLTWRHTPDMTSHTWHLVVTGDGARQQPRPVQAPGSPHRHSGRHHGRPPAPHHPVLPDGPPAAGGDGGPALVPPPEWDLPPVLPATPVHHLLLPAGLLERRHLSLRPPHWAAGGDILHFLSNDIVKALIFEFSDLKGLVHRN